MIAFAKLEKHSLVCIENGEIHILKKKDIIDKKVKVKNIQVTNGKLSGKRFILDKLPEFKSGAKQATIIKVRLTPDEKDIVGYYYIDSLGAVRFADKTDLYTFRKAIILNGSIDINIMVVSNIECLETEKVFNPIHYDIDSYYTIYKHYYSNGLVTHDNKKVSSNIVEFGRLQEYSNSSFENFLGYHKELYVILSKASIIRVVRFYSQNNLKNGVVLKSDEKPLFYIVTFKYNGYTKSVVIHQADKKIIHLIKYKEAKVAKTGITDIKNLVYDTESSDNTISGKSMVDKLNAENREEELNNCINSADKIEIKYGRLIINSTEFKIRRNILIGSFDFRLLDAA